MTIICTASFAACPIIGKKFLIVILSELTAHCLRLADKGGFTADPIRFTADQIRYIGQAVKFRS